MASEKLRVRSITEKEVTLDELVQQNKGLFFPLHKLSEEQREKLRQFVSDLDFEPVAMAHSAATS